MVVWGGSFRLLKCGKLVNYTQLSVLRYSIGGKAGGEGLYFPGYFHLLHTPSGVD